MIEASDFEADQDEIEPRRPTHCPFCGSDTAFDGHGDYVTSTKRMDSDGEKEFQTLWSQHRCPDCNGHFRMLTEAVEVPEDE